MDTPMETAGGSRLHRERWCVILSLGYCGRMELYLEDEKTVIYRYCGENWNDKSETRGNRNNMDGEIVIQKQCFIEPEIHTKIKKTASHKKVLVTKRIIQPFDLNEALKKGDIEIRKPCTSEYSQGPRPGVDRMYFALNLLRHLFIEYQEKGNLPDKCSFII